MAFTALERLRMASLLAKRFFNEGLIPFSTKTNVLGATRLVKAIILMYTLISVKFTEVLISLLAEVGKC